MHRRPLLDQLTSYAATCPDEFPTVSRFQTFINEYPECFERTLPFGHVTGSAWVVNSPGTHTLLTHHRKLDRWLQLGGHCDGHPDVLVVALREAAEESGLKALEAIDESIFDIDIHEIPAHKKEPPHLHYDVRFAIRATAATVFTVSEESHDLAWVAINDIAEYTDEESMLRMARKWLSNGNNR